MRIVLILSTIVLILSTTVAAHKPPSLEPDIPYGGYGLGGSEDCWAEVVLGTTVVGGLIVMAILANLNRGDKDEIKNWSIQAGCLHGLELGRVTPVCRLVVRF